MQTSVFVIWNILLRYLFLFLFLFFLLFI
uniref:Uncharacterized protein n=1 Tax=Anguilla anguilla TaxID=7936 RepID=A0A0E9VK92_ANGAN